MPSLLRSVAPRARLAAAPLLLVVVLGSCRDGTGPVDVRTTLTSGQVVSGRAVGGARAARFRYVAQPGEVMRLSFVARGDSMVVAIMGPSGDSSTVIDTRYAPRDSIDVSLPVGAGPLGGDVYFYVSARRGGGGTYQLSVLGQNRNPESRSAVIQLDEVVEERLDDGNDADDYTLTLAQPADVILYGTSLDAGASAEPISIAAQRVGDSSFFDFGPAISVGGANGQSDVGSLRTPLAAGTWRFTVGRAYLRALPPAARYRMQVKRVDPNPEDRPALLLAGDTAESTIDYRGDLDEYLVRGQPGDEVVGFVQSTGSDPVLFGVAGSSSFDRTPGPLGVPLLRTPIGRRTIPASGELRFAVEGASSLPLRGSSRYRVFVLRSDSLPERGAASIALGDSITNRIDAPGDIDVYQLVLAEPTEVVARVERPTGGGNYSSTFLTVIRGTTRYDTWFGAPPGDTTHAGTGRMLLPAGTYSVRVGEFATTPLTYVGPYTLRVSRVDSLPESRPRTIAIGDTVVGEAIDDAGDRDVFTFQGTAGDTIVVRIRPTVSGTAGVYLNVARPGFFYYLGGASASPDREGVTTRLVLPVSTTYEIIVSGGLDGRGAREYVPYRMSLERFSTLPESRPATIALGDTLTGESIDYGGDVDGFVLTAPAGSDVVVGLQTLSPPGMGGTLDLRAFDDVTGAPVDSQGVGRSFGYIGPIRVAATGRVRLRVAEFDYGCGYPGCTPTFYATGPYRLTSYRIDRGPEGRAATIALGDSLAGEIAPEGDVDEYTFTGTSGDRLELQFDVPYGTFGIDGLRAVVLDPTTGTTLAQVSKYNGSGLADAGVSFTLPRDGSFVLRVAGVQPHMALGRYTARVRRAP